MFGTRLMAGVVILHRKRYAEMLSRFCPVTMRELRILATGLPWETPATGVAMEHTPRRAGGKERLEWVSDSFCWPC